MLLSVDEVTRIAEEAARAVTPSLAVAGVTLGGSADSSYVEVLVDIAGCRQEPCRIEVGAFRSLNEEELREQITGKLREHLARHRTGE